MTFSRLLCGSLLALAALPPRDAVAQDRDVNLDEQSPLVVSGFAVGLGSYDRNLGQNTSTGSKLALSLFRPWSDQLYLFGQLTTHLETGDGEPAHTHIEIDNLIVNWTPARASAVRRRISSSGTR